MENKIVRTADISLRYKASEEEGKESRDVEGIACVFNQSTDMGWFTEEIDRNAFNDCDMSDVVLNFNHDNSLLLARTTAGTLQLSIEEDGLHQKASIVDTTTGRDVLTLIREGLISKMSFAFSVEEDEWSQRKGEKEHRSITKIGRLYDVSLVTFPAYSQTSVSARSEDSLVEEHRKYNEKLAELNERVKAIYGE